MGTPNETPRAPPSLHESGFAPMRRVHERRILTGASVLLAALAFAVFADGAGKWTALVLAVSVGVYFVATGLRGLRAGSASPVLSASLNLIQAGKLAEAEALLATIDERVPGAASAADLQRAHIAVRRGSLAAARDLLDRSIARAADSKDAAALASQARGLRAWARAASGDGDGAREDIDAVRASAEPAGTALAHAALAEAFLAQRRGDRAALAALLHRDRKLLMYGLDVRERALVRAMQRLLGTPSTSVYRTPASVEKAAAGEIEPPIAEWIGLVAPELRPFAPRPPAPSGDAAPAPAPAPSAAMLARVRARTQPASVDTFAQGIAFWGGLALLFNVVYKLAPVPPGPVPIHPWVALGSIALPALVLGMSSAIAKNRRSTAARLQALSARVARGEDVDADLSAIAASDNETAAAQVELLRAAIADRRGLLGQALTHADAARSKLRTEASLAAGAAFIAPAAGASRAYSLAALRRADEAAAELAQLPADYVYLDRTRFVVRLVSLVATGDIDAAGRLVDATSAELSIGPRDELVRDLVRAVTCPGGAGVAEIARLREELRDDDEQRVWIERVAPALLARFERAAVEQATKEPRAALTDDEELAALADLEAIAEGEAIAQGRDEERAARRIR